VQIFSKAARRLCAMATARLGLTALDCADPAVLADFWAALLGGEVAHRNDEFHAVKVDEDWLVAVKVQDYVAPTWPDPTVPKQMHLHLKVDDLDTAQAGAVRLGARVATEQTNPERWRILLDPAGHPFCLATQLLD
jgi:catechol 2,3-dioxygenase-like lactoylglutathione lyase family enzyme